MNFKPTTLVSALVRAGLGGFMIGRVSSRAHQSAGQEQIAGESGFPISATSKSVAEKRSEKRRQRDRSGKKGRDVLPSLIREGVDSAGVWIDGLTDASLKNGAIKIFARDMANSDPAGTASWLMANPRKATQQRLSDVYSIWTEKDQPEAMNPYLGLPTGENRNNTLRGITTSLASTS
jgi:hypothetical protein